VRRRKHAYHVSYQHTGISDRFHRIQYKTPVQDTLVKRDLVQGISVKRDLVQNTVQDTSTRHLGFNTLVERGK
jgi:hypothetical protein